MPDAVKPSEKTVIRILHLDMTQNNGTNSDMAQNIGRKTKIENYVQTYNIYKLKEIALLQVRSRSSNLTVSLATLKPKNTLELAKVNTIKKYTRNLEWK